MEWIRYAEQASLLLDKIMPKTPNVRSFALAYYPATVPALARSLYASVSFGPALASFHLDINATDRSCVFSDPSLNLSGKLYLDWEMLAAKIA